MGTMQPTPGGWPMPGDSYEVRHNMFGWHFYKKRWGEKPKLIMHTLIRDKATAKWVELRLLGVIITGDEYVQK